MLLPLVVTFIVYPLVAKLLLTAVPRRSRMSWFAALNVVFVPVLILAQTAESALSSSGGIVLHVKVAAIAFLVYAAFVVVNYGLSRFSECGDEAKEWIAFLFPLLFLCLVKYWPAKMDPMNAALVKLGGIHRSEFLVGISYMAFRLSLLLREVRNGLVPQPSLAEYLAFAFFIPTMSLGPISSYSRMRNSLAEASDGGGDSGQAWLRILIGLTKYIFLATILNQLTYAGLLLDGHPHSRIDLLIAIPAYALFLYCNFSGFCDMVIGVSALLGLEVSENFDRPFAARNFQEFWTRWHITLSSWFRDMMFTPLLKTLVRAFGPKSVNLMTAVAIIATFLVLGVWHGNGWSFLVFGFLQGLGVATVHYYRLALKRFLSREAFAAYQNSRVIRLACTTLTFAYFSLTLFFFANSVDDIRRIASVLV
ncbi:MAG: MBOAT family O-acyltransferase [Terracidiphilus sp.]